MMKTPPSACGKKIGQLLAYAALKTQDAKIFTQLLKTMKKPVDPYLMGAYEFLMTQAPARGASGVRLSAQNVVVLRVATRDAGYRDPVGNPVPETVLTGSGAAVVLTAGRQVAGRWHKASPFAPLTLTTAAGGPLLVAPGTTWLELVPTLGGAGARIS